MNEIKQKLATAIKLNVRERCAYSYEQHISFRNTGIGFSAGLLNGIGVSLKDKSGVNVYINRKYNVLIFEFLKNPKQGTLSLTPKVGISCTAVYKLLRANGYAVPYGRHAPSSITQDLETGRSYVELNLPGVAK